MRLTRVCVHVALALAVASACVTGAVGVTALASGLFSIAAPAWTIQVRVIGLPLRVSVPGAVRLLTAPGIAHLLAGQSLPTAFGRLDFHRDSRTLVVTCAPCRFQHPRIASVPLVLSRIELRARRDDSRVSGRLAIDSSAADFVAQLAADRIAVRWNLADTDVAALFRALQSIVPEARLARIEGTVQAQGTLELPSGRNSFNFSLHGLEVGGLGTEALQFGWFRIACASPADATRTVITGDGESPWTALDLMGPYLPAAVIAAEDQRYSEHSGFDAIEVEALLSGLEGAPRRGASTLSQQLARTLYTGGERTAARKLRELLYAVEMERTLGKPRILELYLNSVHWGPGICGARAAARRYFNKTVAQLTPIEAAWLAGILREPQTAFSEQFAQRSPNRGRAVWVVRQMRTFPRRDRNRWASEPLVFAVQRPRPLPRGSLPKAPLATRH